MKKTDYHLRFKDTLLGMQFLFVAFGALVLVPALTGLSPSVALFTAGIGTLIFQFITKGSIPPIFLASSLAFIPAIQGGIHRWGEAETMSGLIAAGFVYVILSFIIKQFGEGFITRVLPPVVIGPVIMSIGLFLAPVAIFNATGLSGDGKIQIVPYHDSVIISSITLVTVLLTSLLGKGMLKLIPILMGIIVGYIVSVCLGIVDFTAITNEHWIRMPDFIMPKFSLEAILFILPFAIAPAVEHIGDISTISSVTGENYLQKPGLKKTLLGDGIATMAAACFGGPPNTTYSEVTGAVTITKAFNPAIMTISAIFAICLSFLGKLGAILTTIPLPVMGGILILLFGLIASLGMKTMINHKVDLDCPRNMIIVALILVTSIGGLSFDFNNIPFKGVAVGAIVGIILNLVLPKPKND